ncbi:tryptophan synthase subunit alpha [Chloroflexota bacterium]
MSQIGKVFKKPEKKALIAYVTAGYPSLEATLELVPLLAQNGCDIIEIGIPFSDPMADGATIQHASHIALQNGTTPQDCLELAEKLRNQTDVPLVFMTYYNPVFSYGIEKFCSECRGSGVDGLIIPDLPPDEGMELEAASHKQGLDLVYLLAPTSTKERIRLVAEKSAGFIYLVSVVGITGARDKLPQNLDVFISRVRKETTKPLCVGFGISTPQQAAQVAGIADGVIIGSQIIKLVQQGGDDLTGVCKFIKELRQALDNVSKL